MSKRFLLITTKNEYHVIDVPDSDFLSALKEIIGCECVETAHVVSNIIMLVDEEGKFAGKDVNYIASILYPDFYDLIVGDVILASIIYTDDGPDIGGLNDDDVEYFSKLCDLGVLLEGLLKGE